MYKVQVQTFQNTNIVTKDAAVNVFLGTIQFWRIKSISNYAVGTAASVRYVTTIVYLANP